jgi:hypothetical protein
MHHFSLVHEEQNEVLNSIHFVVTFVAIFAYDKYSSSFTLQFGSHPTKVCTLMVIHCFS